MTLTTETSRPGEKKELTAISQVKIGMSYQEVKAVMGESLVVGYEQKGSPTDSFEPIKMSQPVRVERVTQQNKIYFVVYYYTKVVKADQLISDDELTPLVFESTQPSSGLMGQDKVIGMGMDYVFRIKH